MDVQEIVHPRSLGKPFHAFQLWTTDPPPHLYHLYRKITMPIFKRTGLFCSILSMLSSNSCIILKPSLWSSSVRPVTYSAILSRALKKSSSSFSNLLMHSSSKYFILLIIEDTFLCVYFGRA